MDRGTENAAVAQFQVAFRMAHADERAGPRSIIYGSSPTNSVRTAILRLIVKYCHFTEN